MPMNYTRPTDAATFRPAVLRSIFLALLALTVSLRAAEYIVPVSTGPINQKVYTTTVGIRNDSGSAVTCDWSYLERGGTLLLTARDEVPPGQTIVHEDFASAAGTALGIARASCTGQVTIAARAQISENGGATFPEPGRVFDATPVSGPAGSDAPTAFTARSDLLFAEVGGKAASFSITIRKDKEGDTIGQSRFEVAAYGLQLVSLASMRALAPEVWVEVRVEGAGHIIAERVTEDAKHTQIALRQPAESRESALAHQTTKTSEPAASTQLRGVDAVRALVVSSFKAAPFEDPLTGLVNMRNRWYSRETGTFLSPDPQGYIDSANLYSYCGGDPVNCSDPTGLAAAISTTGWIVATDNRNGGQIRRFSPEEIARDPLAVRAFLGRNADVDARRADALIAEAGQGWSINNARITKVARDVSAGIDDIGRHSTSIYVSSIPWVGDAADARQAWTGYDPIAREPLSKTERVITAVGAALPVVTGKVLREALLESGKTALRQFDIDYYGTFSRNTARVGDQLEGHEMLQNL
jgi:RHS repeat-associated protein